MSYEVYKEMGGTLDRPRDDEATVEPSWCVIECLCYRCITECKYCAAECGCDQGEQILKCERFQA